MNTANYLITLLLGCSVSAYAGAVTLTPVAEVNDSVIKQKAKTKSEISGIDFVNLAGVIKKLGDKFVLDTKAQKTFRLQCTNAEGSKYLGQRVKVSGILLQGYDNPKYGNENLPISQIDSADIINVITSVRIEPDDGK